MVTSSQYEHTVAGARLMMEAFAERRLPEWEHFARTTDLMTVERGTVLVPAHTHHPYVYLVTRGLLKLRFTQARVARTVSFHGEGEIAAAFNGLGVAAFGRVALRATPHLSADPRVWPEGNPFELVAIERTTVLRAGFGAIEELAERSHAWSRMLTTFLSTSMLLMCAGLPDSHLATPEERYRSFVSRRPDLVARISQRELAAHLGVTEVGMSRIVKRVGAQRAAAAAGTDTTAAP
ncbi:hypothetical protein C8046_08525 [Serinibacter arcticus]|uniref:cAMP-binding protein n=1 Tax=Serinibacter arcticus TaxID=1655435 RepID=A0A2U1ZUQ0_9MICO|nr:Crp/Fnr family transcriptional regulator [Serinibacter arcticus]PWD50691.1 hypothetical protein C8046_08525 [Serinibacter arcticus]